MLDASPVESHHETRTGSLHIARYASGLIVAKVTGHFGSGLLPQYLRALTDVARTKRAVGFHDWLDMEGYDSQCRRSMTDWTIRNRDYVQSVHILVKHRLVAMGVSASSLLVGVGLVKTYWDPGEFQAALAKHIPK